MSWTAVAERERRHRFRADGRFPILRTVFVRTKAAWRCASRRSPRHARANLDNAHHSGCAGTLPLPGLFFLDKIFGRRNGERARPGRSRRRPRRRPWRGVTKTMVKVLGSREEFAARARRTTAGGGCAPPNPAPGRCRCRGGFFLIKFLADAKSKSPTSFLSY